MEYDIFDRSRNSGASACGLEAVIPGTDLVLQQPDWKDLTLVCQVRDELAALPGLVSAEEVTALRSLLAHVAGGRLQVIQAGDCAEDPAECTPGHVERKATLLDILAGAMQLNSAKPVLRVGRIAGQFSKPRSQAFERLNGVNLPVYRGHMVNSPEPDPELRKPDPKRLLAGYWAANAAMDAIRHRNALPQSIGGPPIWTSHEALLLDFELPMLRRHPDGGLLLSSTHWPWIGERTRRRDSAHVSMLARVINPVACKIGPSVSVCQLLELCERLDPDREPGRLTFISRMGAGFVTEKLPPLVAAARDNGYPVIWLCDPLHGNTVLSPNGHKFRLVTTAIDEVERFKAAVASEEGIMGGLHLEATPAKVTECAFDESDLAELTDNASVLCDPRLNLEQAVAVASAWHGTSASRELRHIDTACLEPTWTLSS